ncbi:chitobiase/beta-hexosaminidase C-terminal domain-containing protein [Novosphingobium sp. 9]|uniref:chitobiase/beta-hexosaminidase C-terminal domain-containing protein n=1 Tax=Novosphingobium sp. 9 TaxID=2025349 RepID=UPI0021B506E1|nr:chitobiase/beta-hexosaminidase C-terminal domain-containing protein [Novosphingobium sp. 9]
MQHKLFPRAGAVAEDGWSPKVEGAKDYPGFLARLEPQIRRWKQAGVEVADSAFAVTFATTQSRGVALGAPKVGVTLATQAPFGAIRYTLDGTAPTAKSKLYTGALSVKSGLVVTASSFAPDGAMLAAPRRFDTSREALLTTTNGQLAACPGQSLWLRLPLDADATTNGPAYNINIFDPCQADDHAPLAHAKAVTVSIARIPRNFGLAHDVWTQATHYPTSAHGELVASLGCKEAAAANAKDPKAAHHDPLPGAKVLASWALPDPKTAPQRFDVHAVLPADLAMQDESNVCFQFTSPLSDPLYSVEKVVWSEQGQ